jgi:hypothetical protein
MTGSKRNTLESKQRFLSQQLELVDKKAEGRAPKHLC